MVSSCHGPQRPFCLQHKGRKPPLRCSLPGLERAGMMRRVIPCSRLKNPWSKATAILAPPLSTTPSGHPPTPSNTSRHTLPSWPPSTAFPISLLYSWKSVNWFPSLQPSPFLLPTLSSGELPQSLVFSSSGSFIRTLVLKSPPDIPPDMHSRQFPPLLL